jgi:hypothetical protein
MPENTSDRGVKMASQAVSQNEWNTNWERIFNRHESCSKDEIDIEENNEEIYEF